MTFPQPATDSATPAAARLFLFALAAGAVLALFNSFFATFTPDVSFYLLHTRTFVQTLDRYTLSFGEKGPVLTFALAPAVWLLGPTIVAAAAMQVLTYAAAMLFVFLAVARTVDRVTAWFATLLLVLACYSPYVWGIDSIRPEYFALTLTAATFYMVYRRPSRWTLLAGGAVAAVVFHMKTVLAGSLLAILGMQVLIEAWEQGRREGAGFRAGAFLRTGAAGALWAAAGALLVTALVLAWLALAESIPEWYRQNMEWPVASKMDPTIEPFSLIGFVKSVLAGEKINAAQVYRQSNYMGFSTMHVVKLVYKLGLSRMIGLYVLAWAGMLWAFRRTDRRFVLLLAAWLAAESLKVCIDDRRWMYTLSGLIPPMIVGTALLGLPRAAAERRRKLGWVLLLVGLAGVWPVVMYGQAQFFGERVLGGKLSPFEDLAQRMEPVYRKGELVYVNAFNWELCFLLDAPPPYRVLPHHVAMVNDEERAGFYEFYKTNPPVWIAVLNERMEAYPWGYDWIAAGPYELFASNDYAQVWRRVEPGSGN